MELCPFSQDAMTQPPESQWQFALAVPWRIPSIALHRFLSLAEVQSPGPVPSLADENDHGLRNCTPLDHPFAFVLTTDCIGFHKHAL